MALLVGADPHVTPGRRNREIHDACDLAVAYRTAARVDVAETATAPDAADSRLVSLDVAQARELGTSRRVVMELADRVQPAVGVHRACAADASRRAEDAAASTSCG